MKCERSKRARYWVLHHEGHYFVEFDGGAYVTVKLVEYARRFKTRQEARKAITFSIDKFTPRAVR